MKCALALHRQGHEIALFMIAKQAPVYTLSAKDYKYFSKKVGAIL
jgi:hypothetical protein